MKFLVLVSSGLLVLCAVGCSADQNRGGETVKTEQPALPTASPTARMAAFVPNEQEAIDIALKTWIPIYGHDVIDDEKPYVAELKKGVWHVSGSLPDGWVGGVAEIWIQQSDGKVIRYGHGK